MLSRPENLTALEDALSAELRKDPVRFFRQIVMPLLPAEAKIEVADAGPIRWVSLVDTIRAKEAQTFAEQ